MWFLTMIVTITSMQMTLSCPRVLLPISFTVFSPVFKHVLVLFSSGWIATSLSWTPIKQRLCLLVRHLVSLRLRVRKPWRKQCSFQNISEIPRSPSHLDIVYVAAHRQRLSRILPGASTSHIDQTVSLPKCNCKTCRGNDRFSSWLLYLSLRRFTSRPCRSVTANPEQRGTAFYEKKKKTRSRYTSPQRTSLVTCKIPLPV